MPKTNNKTAVKETENAKRGPNRKPHPAIKDDTKLKELPPDYDYFKHASIKRKNWESDHLFFGYKANEHEARAAKFRQVADECKKMGGVKERAKAKRLFKMQEKMQELEKQLREQGIDVDAMKAEAKAKAEAS